MKELLKVPLFRIFLIIFLTGILFSIGIYYDGVFGRGLCFFGIVFSSIFYTEEMAKWEVNRPLKGIHWLRGFLHLLVLGLYPLVIYINTSQVEVLILIPLACSVFYLLFDTAYASYDNIKGDDPFKYVGTQALTDRIVRWLNVHTVLHKLWPAWYILFKIIIVGIFLVLTIKYYL